MNGLQVDLGAPGTGGAARFWSVMSCPRCAGAVVIETNEPTAIQHQQLRILPDEGSTNRVGDLPPDVLSFYRGAIRVLDAGVPDAAAVQLRRTLEAAAAHHGIDSGPLVQRIKKLIEKGLVTAQFGEALDHIRKVGNVGAHASDERVDEETAERALRFTTAFLRDLFEIPAELAALRASSPADVMPTD